MQGNDRGIHGIVWNWVQSARAMQGNEGKYQGNICERCKVPGERRGMQGNAKLTWEWVQCARGMQGNDGKYQGNAKGTYGSGCKVPGEWRGIQFKCMVVGVKCQGNAGEFQGNVWEWV